MRLLLSLQALWVCLTFAVLPACGDDSGDGGAGASGVGGSGGDEPDPDCDGDVPVYTDVTIFDKCTTCHSSENTAGARNGAPSSFNFDTFAAAMASAENAVEEVAEGAMPPANSGITLTEAEKKALYAWGLCGTPE